MRGRDGRVDTGSDRDTQNHFRTVAPDVIGKILTAVRKLGESIIIAQERKGESWDHRTGREAEVGQ